MDAMPGVTHRRDGVAAALPLGPPDDADDADVVRYLGPPSKALLRRAPPRPARP